MSAPAEPAPRGQLRILYLAGADLSLAQGQAAHIRRLTEALERRGHTVRLLVHHPSRPLDWKGPSGGLECARRPAIPRLGHPAVELSLARRARRSLRRFSPDLWLVRAELYSFAPLLVRRARVPLVVETNASVPAILRAAGASALQLALARALEGTLLRRADAIGAVTESLARIQITAHHLPPGRMRVVPNGAWLPPLPGPRGAELRRKNGVEENEFLLGFAGNLNHVQALGVVLRALATLSGLPWRLWVIGEGARRSLLERQCADLALGGRVRFLGGMTEEDAARHACACHLLLAPYEASAYEALGGGASALKVLQALACDRPLLAGRVRGLESIELLVRGEPSAGSSSAAGELVEAEDPSAWAQAIRRRAEAWRARGNPASDWPWPEGEGAGRRYIRAARTWDHCAEAWEEVFALALSRGTDPPA